MIQFKILPFKELSNVEVYESLRLRSEVFVVEQKCPYLDADGKDLDAFHVLGYVEDKIVAYARLLAVGISYNYPSIGRVVVAANYRSFGYGHDLIDTAMEHCKKLYGDLPIKISAQLYLEKFYKAHGFETISEPYLEDDIPHIAMISKANQEA